VRAAARIDAVLPGAIVERALSGRHPSIRVGVERLREVCRLLRDDPDLRMDSCHLISGVDWPAAKPGEAAEIEVIWHLVSYSRPREPEYRGRDPRREKTDGWLAVKVRVPRDRAEVPSVADLWTGADWHERETWDLMGVRFTGRRDLRRILLPEDWPGHPLRKDWEYPSDYHGVPIVSPEEQELP
jgi:NADH-quinone oxidoreductase subunit C